MFVIDLNALQTVHVLNLVDNIVGNGINTAQSQYIVRRFGTLGDHFTLLNAFTLEYVEVSGQSNHFLVCGNEIAELVLGTLGRSNDKTTFGLGLLTEGNGTGDLGQYGRLLGRTSFEQIGNTRQTAGNILGTACNLRNTCDHVTEVDLSSVLQLHNGLSLQHVLSGHVSSGDHDIIAVCIDDLDRRTFFLTGSGTSCQLTDLDGGNAQSLILLLIDGHTLDNIDISDEAAHLRNDGMSMRIPTGNGLTDLNLIAFLNVQYCTVRDLMRFLDRPEIVHNEHFGLTGNNYILAVGISNGLGIFDLNLTVVAYGCSGLCYGTRCRTADVEGTHGKLGSGLTDGLCGNDADGLTGIDLLAAGEITTVALGADAELALTGNRRANLNSVDLCRLEQITKLLIKQSACRDQYILGAGLQYVDSHGSTEHAITQVLNYITAGNVRSNEQSVISTAVFLGDHQILSNVDKTTSQITGVCGLQGGIGQTLTCTVS